MFNCFFGLPSAGPYNRRCGANHRRNTGPFMGGMPPEHQFTAPNGRRVPPYGCPVPPCDCPVPPCDCPVPPCDGSVPLRDRSVPSCDCPVPPYGRSAPLCGCPVPPCDGPVPPRDRPVPSCDGPVPSRDRPALPCSRSVSPCSPSKERSRSYMPVFSGENQDMAFGGALGDSEEGTIEVKFSSNGDITLPNHTKQGDTYNISSINLDTAGRRRFRVKLDFSCNVCITDASLHLRFQIFKQGTGPMTPLPVGPGYHFSRQVKGTESNTIAFFAHDCESGNSASCNYSVYMKVMGDETNGTARILNPVLIAALREP